MYFHILRLKLCWKRKQLISANTIKYDIYNNQKCNKKKHDKVISQRNTRYLVNKLLAQLPFAWQKKLAAAPLFPKMAV